MPRYYLIEFMYAESTNLVILTYLHCERLLGDNFITVIIGGRRGDNGGSSGIDRVNRELVLTCNLLIYSRETPRAVITICHEYHVFVVLIPKID